MIDAQIILPDAANIIVPVYKQLKGEDEGLPRNQTSKTCQRLLTLNFSLS